MALSGTLYNQFRDGYRLQLEWSATQSIAENKSTVVAYLYLMSTESYATISSTAAKTGKITVDGSSSSRSDLTAGLTAWQKKLLFSYTKEISHESNGQKSFSLSAEFGINVTLSGKYWGTITIAAQTFTLDTIPRYAAITSFSASSITRDSFKLNYVTDKAVSEVQYSTNGGAWTAFPANGVFSGSANAEYSMKIRVKASDSGLWTESSAISVVLVKTAAANKPALSSNTCIQAVLNWSSTQTVTEVQYKIGSGSWVSAGTFTARSSGSFTVPGLTPGQAVTIYVRVKDAVHGTLSGQSEGLSVTPVALSSISSGANFNLESDLPVTISRPSSSLYHDITLEAYYDGAWNVVAINTAQSNKTDSGNLSPSSAAVNTLFTKHVDPRWRRQARHKAIRRRTL